MRIHDEDCDVEPLDESDFDMEETGFPQIVGTQAPYHTLYVIQMSKLAVLCMFPSIPARCHMLKLTVTQWAGSSGRNFQPVGGVTPMTQVLSHRISYVGNNRFRLNWLLARWIAL